MNEKVRRGSAEPIFKAFVYVVLITLAILIIVPVAWVFLASIKQNSEFYGNPWALPAGFYWQNFVDAWNSASMGSYMINSVIVTALSLALLLVVALPAAYCLSRFHFTGRKLLNTCFLKNSFLLPFRLLNLILSLVISFNPFRFKSYDIIFIKIVYKLLSNCIKINLSSIQYTTPIVIEFRQYRITFNVFYHQRAFHIMDQSRNSQIV